MTTERFEVSQDLFAEYIDWRAEHPSDDLMTEMLIAEFEDETGTIRRLTREEILTYVNLIAGAGNETTTNLIGNAAVCLATRELGDGRPRFSSSPHRRRRRAPHRPHRRASLRTKAGPRRCWQPYSR